MASKQLRQLKRGGRGKSADVSWPCAAVGMGGEEESRAAFALFDVDGSGTIDADELQQLAAQLGSRMSAADVQKVMEEVDTDGSGEIDADEFSVWWAERRGAQQQWTGRLRRKVKGALASAARSVLLTEGKLKLQVGSATLAKWGYNHLELRVAPSADGGSFELRGAAEGKKQRPKRQAEQPVSRTTHDHLLTQGRAAGYQLLLQGPLRSSSG